MNQRYPISFSKKNEYETSDFRFIDVCIDVMHTGANLMMGNSSMVAIV